MAEKLSNTLRIASRNIKKAFILLPSILIVIYLSCRNYGQESWIQTDQFEDEIIFYRDAVQKCSAEAKYCLIDEGYWGEDKGRPAKGQVQADEGVGRTLLIMAKSEKPITLLQIGAGVGQYGHWLAYNKAKGIKWTGYDQAENVVSFTNGFVKNFDHTKLNSHLGYVADWVMCLEVGEYVHRLDEFISFIGKHNRKGVILSLAVRDQGSLTELDPSLTSLESTIIDKMLQAGYEVNEHSKALQKEIRTYCIYYWIQKTMLVFHRK